MIDSHGRPTAELPSGSEVAARGDQYTFVDESFTIAQKNFPLKSLSRRGLKRTYKDIIKSDPCEVIQSDLKTQSPVGSSLVCEVPVSPSVRSSSLNESIPNSVNRTCTADAESEYLNNSFSVSNNSSTWATSNSTDSNNNSSSDNNSFRTQNVAADNEVSNVTVSNESAENNVTNGGSGRGRISGRRGKSYGLRPRASLRRSGDEKDSPERPHRKSGRRGRARGHTLSKYRRNTANARERDRMREINTAFATLRGVLPSFACRRIASMTKITTLKLATSYIRALADLLKDPPPQPQPNVQFFPPALPNPSTSVVLPTSISGMSCYGQGLLNRPCDADGRPTMEASSPCFDGRVDPVVEGRVEGRWWSAVESDVLQGIGSEIAWDDLTLPDICWGMS